MYCAISKNQVYPEQVPTGAFAYTVFNVTNQISVYLSGLLPFTFYQCYVTANTIAGEGSPSIISICQTSQAGVKILHFPYVHLFMSSCTPSVFPNHMTKSCSLLLTIRQPMACTNHMHWFLNISIPLCLNEYILFSLAPSAPLNFTLSNVLASPTFLSATWSVPLQRNGIIIGYSVYCNTSINQPFPEQVIGPNIPNLRSVVSGTQLAVSFNTGLKPYTQYSCYVTANTSFGQSSSSSLVTALTAQSGNLAVSKDGKVYACEGFFGHLNGALQ